MNTELHVSLSNGHSIGKSSSNYRKFNENSIILDTSFCKGVSPLYSPKQTEQKWFLMRASYGQEQKACDYLQEKGIKAFCPKWKQERTYGDKKVIVEVSMIPNTLFVHSTEKEMRCYIGKSPLTYFHHYYCKDINSPRCRKPIIVPDSQMHAFMLWVKTDSADKIYNKDGNFNFKRGDHVRVTSGDFAGFTGYVMRYKGQTRVGISIDNIGTIFTAYIPKSLLVKISN